MKARHYLFFCLIGLFLNLISCKSERGSELTLSELETSFKTVPDSVKIGVYWYWISNNISKEGVIRDLQSMKKVGINRAFIGNVALPEVAEGNVKVLSDEWWDIVHTALKTATELGIEIGIFNGPGWSQSGGPWITDNQSMRYLDNASVSVEGGRDTVIVLPEIKNGQDVKVLAYPVLPESQEKWSFTKKEGEEIGLQLRAPAPNMRSLIFKTDTPIKSLGKIYAKERNTFLLLKSFDIDRSNFNLNVGFVPNAPLVISLPENQADVYKFEMSGSGSGNCTVELSSKPYVEYYAEKTLAKMFPTPLPMWKDYLWEEQPLVSDKKQVLDTETILDLTSDVDKGVLTCHLPEGQWKVVRYAMKTTGVTNAPAAPEATGLEVDKMNSKHLEYHFNAFIGEILKRIPEEDRKCFKVAVMDSYETGGMNWTDDMEKKFIETYGYSPVPYLPVLHGEVVGSPDISDRFLWDLRRLIADCVSYEYVGALSKLSHQHGLTTWLENYGHWGFPGEFLKYGGQSDEVAGEFWTTGDLGNIENRAASSCAHIYGKRKVWAESFTVGGGDFTHDPCEMKQRGDRFFTEGINATLLHVYIHQPYEDRFPGINASFGSEFNRHNTWFSQLDLFIDYLKRCNMMLQSGKYVADIAYFIGEDTPKMTGPVDPAVPKGYAFDYINGEVLLKSASVKDGYLVLSSGMKYRVLILPDLKTMRPEILQKIKSFVHDGLIVFGNAPERSPSLQNYPDADKEVRTLAEEIWGDKHVLSRKYGKGVVYSRGYCLDSLLLENHILPDMKIEEDVPVLFIHRKMPDGDLYFISNQSQESVKFTPIFRVKNMQPELWNPVTGEIRYLPKYTCSEQGTTLDLQLDGSESAFVVFRHCNSTFDEGINYPILREELSIEGPWDVHFKSIDGVLDKVVKVNQLDSWTNAEDNDIKYFSGIATYRTIFQVDSIVSKSVYLDLGKVKVMAKVKLNGKYVGGVWTAPYRLAITDKIQKGKNVLEVEVVNNWVNRIIGDLNLPENERHTWANVITWHPDSELQQSGLLGPVRLIGTSELHFVE